MKDEGGRIKEGTGRRGQVATGGDMADQSMISY
jgi:hypothetical protein